MSIVFDEIVGTVTADRPEEKAEEKEEKKQRERPLTLATLRLINAQTRHHQRRKARLMAD